MPKIEFWVDRFKHFWAYAIVGIVIAMFSLGIYGIYRHFFPKKLGATSSTNTTIGSGGTATITNINYKPEDNSQGLYVSLSTDRNTVGVYKTFASRFEIQLGAGKDYDDNAVAEVIGKVKF